MILIGCTFSPIKETEYVKQTLPVAPADPVYYQVTFQKINGFYCLDVNNAKDILKNRELDNGVKTEYKAIWEGEK